ncbi:MAG: nucleoside hydrolase [Halobacteriales archaeon]|nr:nucleoside hydrolase [Halobacteriales archaeon]
MASEPRPVIVDTDTAGDDTQALMYAAATDRLELEAVTICAGNVPFDYQVENAKHTLEIAGLADKVTVYEGARKPLLVDSDHADYVHGEGGLGGKRFPDTGIPSGDRHAANYIVDAARERPGELTLVCIAPLTNLALALRLESDLGALLDEVWVMGGNVNCLGNVTPAAEYNFWFDPHAARLAMDELDVTLFDWGVTVRDSAFTGATIDGWLAELDTERAALFGDISGSVREFTEAELGEDMTTQPDAGLVAALAGPELIEAEGTYHVSVDEREGITRGYTAVDELGGGDGEPRTRVIEAIDGERFRAGFRAMLAGRAPESAW